MNAPARSSTFTVRLRQQLTGPSAFLVVSTVLMNVARIFNTVVLTRLLAPDVFGLSGIILSTFFVIGMISDVGFQAYVVRHHKGDDPKFLDAVWSIHVSRGIILAATAMIFAFPVGHLLQKPALPLPLMGAALIFIIDGMTSTTMFTALRTGSVRRLSVIDLVVALVQMVFGILAAFVLRNIWAVIASMIFGSLLKTMASYFAFPNSRRRFGYDPEVSADLWRFSRMIGASSILTLFIAQTDKLVLARGLTLDEFGAYAIAATLAVAPTGLVGTYAARIIYPLMARVWQTAPETMRETFYASRGMVFYLYGFGGGMMIGGAGLLIRLLYDPRYVLAATYLPILAISTALFMMTHSAQEAMVAMGRTRTTFEMNVVRIAWLVAGTLLMLTPAGSMAIVIAVGTIELPAYIYASIAMRRLEVFSVRYEAIALLAIGAGVAAGAAAQIIGTMLFPSL